MFAGVRPGVTCLAHIGGTRRAERSGHQVGAPAHAERKMSVSGEGIAVGLAIGLLLSVVGVGIYSLVVVRHRKVAPSMPEKRTEAGSLKCGGDVWVDPEKGDVSGRGGDWARVGGGMASSGDSIGAPREVGKMGPKSPNCGSPDKWPDWRHRPRPRI